MYTPARAGGKPGRAIGLTTANRKITISRIVAGHGDCPSWHPPEEPAAFRLRVGGEGG
jgi:hypothetical protein